MRGPLRACQSLALETDPPGQVPAATRARGRGAAPLASVPQYPHVDVESRHRPSPYQAGEGLTQLINAAHLRQCLVWRECSINITCYYPTTF